MLIELHKPESIGKDVPAFHAANRPYGLHFVVVRKRYWNREARKLAGMVGKPVGESVLVVTAGSKENSMEEAVAFPIFEWAEAFRRKILKLAAREYVDTNKRVFAAWTAVAKAGTDSAKSHYRRGIEIGILGHHKEAIKHFDKAIRIKPNYAKAYCCRGISKDKLGNPMGAFKDFEVAIRIEPSLAKAYYCRGKLYDRLGHHKQAILDFDRSIRILPNFGDAYNDRGLAKANLGYYAESVSDFDMAIRINSDNADAFNNRGVAKYKLGFFEESVNDLDEAIRIKPDFAAAYGNRATAKALVCIKVALKAQYGMFNSKSKATRAIHDSFRKAIKNFDELIRIWPNISEVYHNRGTFYTLLGRHRRAIKDFDMAIHINPDYADAYCRRGYAKMKLGHLWEAIRDYVRAIRLRPFHPEAHRYLKTARAELYGRSMRRSYRY